MKPSKFLSTSFLYNNGDDEEEDEIRKPKSINNSTLSIHIAAYENSIEASNDADYDENEGLKKKCEKLVLNKKWKNVKQFINPSSASTSENPFQFPRQQENEENSTPELFQFKASQRLLNPNAVKSDKENDPPSTSQKATQKRIFERELQKEVKVKEGFEKFFNCEPKTRAYNHKLMEETHQLYEDNKAKITYLKMQIDRLTIQEQSNGENVQSKSDAAIDDLLYRLHPEEKIDLIRLALKKYMNSLPSESPKRLQIRKEIDPRSNDIRFSSPASYGCSTYGDTTPKASFIPRHFVDRRSGPPMPTLAVSGTLELNIHGVLDLIGDIPGRTNRGAVTSVAGGNCYSDLGIFKTAKTTSQNARGLLNDEVYAILRIDNHIVAQTDAKHAGKQCWNHKTSINLDRVRELEVEIYYRDYRSMCAFAVLKLGNLIEIQERKESTGITLPLEPQGAIFFEFAYFDPVVSRK
uniref:Uncharacterized protein n=1 Tax=Panagrolaimus sp. ES5 TaxID=591445 RepID=A0AC34GR91_9BILA